MMDSYNNLCTFNFGKRNYIIMKNNIKIMYFENVDGNYEMPIVSFNLYDNIGKSLTVVNQHFFMTQLVNRLNIAFKKGIFSSGEELVSFLNNLKVNIEKNDYLRKLFKGSFMKDIDEPNFENNKREIMKYLDSFRFDTFVNYNNVSIFTGSLEKDSNNLGVSSFQASNDNLSDAGVDLENTSNTVISDELKSFYQNSDLGNSLDSQAVSSSDYFSSNNSSNIPQTNNESI